MHQLAVSQFADLSTLADCKILNVIFYSLYLIMVFR